MVLYWEYAAIYGEPDVHRLSWARFLAGVAATARFTARQLYAAIVGPCFALSGLSSEGAGERMQMHEELRTVAFGDSYKTQPEPRRLIIGPDEA